MANTEHYPAGAPQGKGGQFAPKNAGATETGAESAISYIPKTMSNGRPRVYFSDLPQEQQEAWEKEYINKHINVLRDNDYLYDTQKTSNIDTQERKFQRATWINDEFESQMNNGVKKQERKATLILGLPGSGKSTIANPLSKEMGAFIVDADSFKNRIPEFQKDHRMVSAVHHESVNLSNEFRNQLSNSGYNMVIGKVGGDYKSVGYILDELANKGYSIDVILNDVPMETVLKRSEERFDKGETDRLVPFWTTKIADKNVYNTFDEVLKHQAVKGGKIYNNDVPEGQGPQLLKEFKK